MYPELYLQELDHGNHMAGNANTFVAAGFETPSPFKYPTYATPSCVVADLFTFE